MSQPTTSHDPPPTAPGGKTKLGIVTRDKMSKTRRVEVERLVPHARYGKFMKRRTVCHAHDEANETHLGDIVEIMESRPLSKLKRWRIVRIVRPGAQQALAGEGEAPAAAAAQCLIASPGVRPRRSPDSSVSTHPTDRPGVHDPDANAARRGRQHRGQGSHVLQGPGR